MRLVNSLLLGLVVFEATCLGDELPSFLHVCSRNEPNLLECFITAGDTLKPYFAQGVPEYDIPSMEPLVMNELIAEQTEGLLITATDVKTWGCTDFYIRQLKVDFEKLTFEIDVDLPLLQIDSVYNMTGKILVMPIKGNGPLKANVTDCKSKNFLQGELYEKDGQTHLRFTEFTVKVDVGGGRIKIDNLFNGDKMLNDIVNETANKNLKPFLDELMPVVERALSATFLDIANKIVRRFTFDQLFPV